MVGGLHKYRPIHVKTVAQALVHTARSQVKGEHVYLSEEIANRGNAKKAADSTQPP
jgi:hypothetical protein